VLGLFALGLFTRLFSTNSLAGEPTPDEYLYGVYARDIARAWAAGLSPSFSVADEGRTIVLEAAALSFVLPWDQITIGRAVQALFNALCIPACYLVGRQLPLSRGAAFAASLVLLAMPEFQEVAWRFWSDSQAVLLGLIFLGAVLTYRRQPSAGALLLAGLAVVLLFATKDSIAFTYGLLLPVFAVTWLLKGRGRSRGTVGIVLAVIGVLVVGLLLSFGFGGELARIPVLGRAFLVGPLLVEALAAVPTQVGPYFNELAGYFQLRASSAAFVVSWLVGFGALAFGLLRQPGRARTAATLLFWLPWALVGGLALADSGQFPAWLMTAFGLALLVWVTVFFGAPRMPAGLTWIGLAALLFLVQRLLVLALPRLGETATFNLRPFLPIVPLIALLAGWGLGEVGRIVALVRPRLLLYASPALAVLLVVFASPVLTERFSLTPMLGRTADRGADPTSPQGLRVETLVAAQDWLRANIRPTDVTLTTIPRQLAWYADLGVQGMDGLVNVAGQSRSNEARRAYVMERLGPDGADYVVDFNLDWTQPSSAAAQEWQSTYLALASTPGLQEAYVAKDRFGNPVLYVFRNLGYAR
jgi:4-amino-4-deoxy-L-arabinose transferase-like glycosyltransferase